VCLCVSLCVVQIYHAVGLDTDLAAMPAGGGGGEGGEGTAESCLLMGIGSKCVFARTHM
jgi:hypothetical protein